MSEKIIKNLHEMLEDPWPYNGSSQSVEEASKRETYLREAISYIKYFEGISFAHD